MSPSPPHFTPLMNLVWVAIVITHRRVCESHTCRHVRAHDVPETLNHSLPLPPVLSAWRSCELSYLEQCAYLEEYLP
jgi:hypothetical protein